MAKKFEHPDLTVAQVSGAVMSGFKLKDDRGIDVHAIQVPVAMTERSQEERRAGVIMLFSKYSWESAFIDVRVTRAGWRDANSTRRWGNLLPGRAYVAAPKGCVTLDDVRQENIGLITVDSDLVVEEVFTPVKSPRAAPLNGMMFLAIRQLALDVRNDEFLDAMKEKLRAECLERAREDVRAEIARADRERDNAQRERDKVLKRMEDFKAATGLTVDTNSYAMNDDLRRIKAASSSDLGLLPDKILTARRSLDTMSVALGKIETEFEALAKAVDRDSPVPGV